MTIATNNVIAKIAAVVAGLGLVAMSFAAYAPAKADTTTTTSSSSDTAAQIASLMAQIQALQAQLSGSQTMTASVTFSRDLTMGSKGTDVTALQNWLIAKGFTISAGATGYFGAQTKAALAAYQSANGISPAAGYFGPITRAKVNASSTTTTTTTTTTTGTGTTTTGTTTTLSGGEGSLDNFKYLGSTSTSLNQNDSDTVYGFEFRAGGSDLSVNRVDYDLYNSNGLGSLRPWNVFQTATLMNGTTVVATLDASNINNFSEDGTNTATGNQIYRLRFDGLKDVTKMGNTADYYLKLSTQNAISNSNSGATYTIYLAGQGVRAVDAMGIQEYSSSSTGTRNTVSVSNSTNGSLVISTDSANPQTSTVMGDRNNSTSGITLNVFTIQAKDTDATVYSIPVRVTTTGSSVSQVIRNLKLYAGSTLLDTESFSATSSMSATTTFTRLNYKVPANSTQTFKVVAEVNSVDGANFTEGSTVTLTVPGNGQDIEDSSGNQIASTGASTGNTVTVRSIGLGADATPSVASAVSTNNGANTTQQTGTFTFTFNVTAFGQDVYLASTSVAANNGEPAFNASLISSASGSTTPTATALSSTADRTTDGSNTYVIHNGQTKQVTVTVARNGGNNGFYYAKLNRLYFATSSAATMSIGTESFITLPSAYQTSQVIING